MRPAVLAGLLGGPTLNLDMVAMGVNGLDSRITFDRASNATMFDSQGRMVWAPANLLTVSADLSNAAWVLQGSATITGTTQVNLTASSLDRIGIQSPVTTSTVGCPWTYSSLLSGTGKCMLQIFDAGGAFPGTNSADITLTSTPTWYSVARTHSEAGANRMQCKISAVASAPAAATVVCGGNQLELTGVDSPKAYNATSGSAYYGPRFDTGPATLAPLGLLIEEQRTNFSNGGSLTSTWTGNAATISAGVSSIGQQFTRITADGTLAQHCGQTAWTTGIVGSTAHIVSCFVRRVDQDWIQLRGASAWDNGLFTQYVNFNLATGLFGTIGGAVTTYAAQYIGDGVYRLVMDVTSKAVPVAGPCGLVNIISGTAAVYGEATNTLTTSVDVFGMQVEAGSFATSLIPTFGTAATRAADSAKMTGTNFSSWFNSAAQLAGTICASGTPMTPASNSNNQPLLSIDNATGSGTERHYLLRNATNSFAGAVMMIANATILNPAFAAWASGTTGKFAYAYAASDQSITFNGAAVQTFTNVGLPAVTQMVLGARTDAVLQFNGWIKSVQFYPARLPNAQLQALTA
jgi:hypothetical protein